MAATVRAKFKVEEVRHHTAVKQVVDKDGRTTWVPAEMRTVILSPVFGNGDPRHENTKFWQATPTGKIELGCCNPDAASAFELGREYYVDFTPAG